MARFGFSRGGSKPQLLGGALKWFFDRKADEKEENIYSKSCATVPAVSQFPLFSCCQWLTFEEELLISVSPRQALHPVCYPSSIGVYTVPLTPISEPSQPLSLFFFFKYKCICFHHLHVIPIVQMGESRHGGTK